MTFSYFDVNTINSKRHMQLGPDDSESFPAVCGANKVCICICFVLTFEVIKKGKYILQTCFQWDILSNFMFSFITQIVLVTGS